MVNMKAEPTTTDEEKAKAERALYAELMMEAFARLCGDYANQILTPRIFAERRRRRGDSSASPRDYDCRCDLSRDDGLPICEGRRANCKFAHRTSPPSRDCDNRVWHTVKDAEKKRIARELLRKDDDALFAEILRMVAALEKEEKRAKREQGLGGGESATGMVNDGW